MKKKIAIIGGGPSGLFMYKTLVEKQDKNLIIHIYEKKKTLGAGMPYSEEGSNGEHVTNVSANEIPTFPISLMEWIKTLPEEHLKKYNLDKNKVHEFMVLPRLLFGEYLSAQFLLIKQKADETGLNTTVHFSSNVTDIIDDAANNKMHIELEDNTHRDFDIVIICTGHIWSKIHEGKTPGYFDSPYPPAKLQQQFNHTIALRGSSLTAIDAIRTLARTHGYFLRDDDDETLSFIINDSSPDFKIDMYSRQGLLPAMRFHLDNPRLTSKFLLTKKEIDEHIKNNNGFLSLDFIFEKDFKNLFINKDPAFYQQIKDMSVETFVDLMMTFRESIDPFLLLKGEYEEAKKSIKRKQSIYWKEMLGVLSFAMNYPAKHLSAEDMQRLNKILMPLISVVIAYLPQTSAKELIALHNAGKIELIAAGDESDVEINNEGEIIYHHINEEKKVSKKYKTFIDCIGQKHLSLESFPFQKLVSNESVSSAFLKYRNPEKINADEKNYKDVNNNFFLKVPGVAITDSFRAVMKNGESNNRLYIMAVAYIGGFNPDYSGLDFCEAASKIIAEDILSE